MRLLDLFCGAGGASFGYHQAGFDDITGIDIVPMKRYPFRFIQADALEYLAAHGHKYDLIHASPPCQTHSVLKTMWNARQHENFLPQTRHALQGIGKPYVIENVVGAPMDVTLMLCGSMFGLETPCGAQLQRHRLFESNVMLMSPGDCYHSCGRQRTKRTISVNGHEFRNEASRWQERRTITVVGGTPHDPARERRKYKTQKVPGSTAQQNVERNWIRETFSVGYARIAMGINWMVMSELSQAIPPAYTEWVGRQIKDSLKEGACN